MFISNIRIKNFKSFDNLNIDFNKFNVIIGACGAGKTNLVEIFEFFKDISQNFHQAVKSHGGIYIKNLNAFDSDEESYLGITFNNGDNNDMSLELKSDNFGLDEDVFIDFYKLDYEVHFKFISDLCEVLSEKIELSCKINDSQSNVIIIQNNFGEISAEFLNPVDFLDINMIISHSLIYFVSQNFIKDNTPIINSGLSNIPFDWNGFFSKIKVYDFDPKVCKNINDINNDLELTKYGGNLPVILNNILKDSKKRKDFLIYYTTILNYINDVSVEEIFDEKYVFTIVEKYNDVKLPSMFLSDGSSTILALLIAVYFQEGDILLIEEPERYIHPSLISELLLMFESNRDKQIILTSHSPVLLRFCELENIYFISRDEKGFSNIEKVMDDDFAKPFIEELGVDNVFVNNLLGLK